MSIAIVQAVEKDGTLSRQKMKIKRDPMKPIKTFIVWFTWTAFVFWFGSIYGSIY